MHPRAIVDAALELAATGTPVADVGTRLGVPRRTVADWINGSIPHSAFKNRSTDIHRIFRDACERVGVRWTAAGVDTTYVSRQADVAILDEFIGPKR